MARHLVACVGPAVESLRSGGKLLNDLDSPGRVRSYFNVVPYAIEERTLDELGERVRGNLPFHNQEILTSWRDAEQAARTCQRRFGELRDQSVLPEQGPNILASECERNLVGN